MQRSWLVGLVLIARTLVSTSHDIRAMSESEAKIRAEAIRLYNQQPLVPVTSMDEEFGGSSSTSPASSPKSSIGMAPAHTGLKFAKTWLVLDSVSKVSRDLGHDEGALMAAISQQLDKEPLLCIHGFSMGHAAIAWLEANAGATVALLHPLEHLSESSAYAFVKTLYPGRVILMEQALPLLRSARCQAVHINLLGNRDHEVLELLQGILPSIVTPQHVLMFGGGAESATRLWSQVKSLGIVEETLGVNGDPTRTCGLAHDITSCNIEHNNIDNNKCQYSQASKGQSLLRSYYVGHFPRAQS